MNTARKLLLTTTAGLAMIFAGCTGTHAQAQASPSADAAQTVSITTVMKDYNTAATQRLRKLEAEFNKERPAGSPAIVFIDYDQVATWFSLQEGPDRLDKAVGDYLTSRTGKTYDAATLARLANAMDRLQPAAFTPRSGSAECLVVPEFPGISFDTFYATSFQVGTQNPLTGKVVILNLSTQEFGDFANAHESWHCLDTRYRNDTGEGLAGAVKENRTEMFADLGGVMEGIRNGANLTLIDKIAAERATWVFLTGPERTKTPESHEDHYKSIIYHTHPGLYALKSRIQDMGIENFRKLSRAEMRDMAYEIVDANALSYTRAAGLQGYYATGRAATAMQPDIARLQSIADSSVREATPQELAARKAAAKNGGMTETALLEALKSRAGELGGASNFSSQLKARQEMTDRLRGKLSSSPSTERDTEGQLKLLFYSDPHLKPRGG
jgi:hypothetical protein